MESATKNKKNLHQLSDITSASLSVPLLSAHELTEGYCNAAYKLALADGRTCVLKIAPRSEENLLTYEKGMMQAEVSAMRLAQAYGGVPVAQVYAADDTCTVCDSPFFIMECLPGESLAKIKGQLSPETVREIYIELGKILNRLHKICAGQFGMLAGQFQSSSWFSTFWQMMASLLENAQVREITLGVDPERILEYLYTRKDIFDEVKIACLIHWDTWDGNLLIKEGKIAGIIDWERAFWGDVLMEYNFRSFAWNTDFLDGYGKTSFTPQKRERITWYDTYLNLILYIEAFYRMYPERQGALRALTRFQKTMAEMGL